MKSISIERKKTVLVIIMLVAFFAVGQVLLASPVSASLAESTEFLEIMDEIGHDMEHIHEDMHVVAYNLRLLAYSNIAIAILLLIGVIGLFKKS